ncbi:RICIN domain-containing protein [Bifidobacterium imperatoris]|uniref:1,4-beta-N-acetylmuramidase n=1 Tax=Bifidobacterium imperatoris TaxID=2020965 RepID=A0A2N5IUZ3_9BIFI|nr:RICIN domain-containing protein [Bifidobacterium imperatoris]PLS25784.1 1,4-beta-N-acetylmuramidase [Bifidobacterium imperatoris]QSY58258.1 RICIN domain-containing protein [Bifidobacterium imperatoris]
MGKSWMSVVAVAASAAMLGAISIAPANAVSDVNLDAAGSASGSASTSSVNAFQTQAIDDSTVADAMPDNPDAALPDKVSADIPDDATVVSENHAVTANGELKDIETGETVTDPNLVGTEDKQPDPLAKTDGESFIPVQADEVKQKVEEVKGAAAVGGETASDSSSADSSDDSAGTDADETTGTAGIASDKQSTQSSVKLASLQNNDYGAHWGTYNDTQAFFDANNNLFVQQAKGVIDVSTYQGTIDWQAAKNAGVEGAIIRISYGWDNGFDTQALRNISECKRLGIPFGVYSYSYAYDSATAANEGNDIVKLLKQAGVNPGDLSYPVFYDLERWSWTGHTPPTDPNVYDGIVNTWYSKLKAAGYNNLGVYSYTSYLNSSLNKASIHAKTRWVAQYGSTMGFTSWPTNDRGWQYTSGGSIAGISGSVDLNAFGYKEYQAAVDVRTLNTVSVADGAYYINAVAEDSSGVEIADGDVSDGAVTRLWQADGGSNQRFVFTKQSDGSFEIKNQASGKVLDVANGVPGNGAVVRQWSANGSAAQHWFIRDSGEGYYLQSALGNYVLDLAGGSTANGTVARLYAPNGTVAQKFMMASAGVNVPSGTVVVRSGLSASLLFDVRGESVSAGARIQTWSWSKSDSQVFSLQSVGNGVVVISNVHSGKVLEAAGGGVSDGTAVQQWWSNGTLAQHWMMQDAGDGYVSFRNARSGKVIDVPNASTAKGAGLQLWSASGSNAQRWNVVEQKDSRGRLDDLALKNRDVLKDGSYRVSSHGSQAVLDVSNGSSSDGANVQLWRWAGVDQQLWRVSHDAKGYVTLTNVRSGKVLDVSNGVAAAGTNVQQWSSAGAWAQKWIAVPDSDGMVRLVSGLDERVVLDADAARTANGTNVHVWSAAGSDSQRWWFIATKGTRDSLDDFAAVHFNDLKDGVYSLSSHGSQAVLDVSNGSSSDGANVQLWRWAGVDQQLWRVSHDAKGYVTLTNVRSGKVLDVSNGVAAAGTNVQQWSSAGAWAQKWIAVKTEDGSYRFVSGLSKSLSLDADCAKTTNGTNIHLWVSSNDPAQRWTLIPR